MGSEEVKVKKCYIHNGQILVAPGNRTFLTLLGEGHTEDTKTAIAKNIPPIPKGTVIEVKDVVTNYYGTWVETVYKGNLYYLDPTILVYRGNYKECPSCGYMGTEKDALFDFYRCPSCGYMFK